MLIELLTAGIVLLALLIIVAVLIQEGKGDMGLGSASRQILFGGSGGQNILEKITWVIGFLFMAIALGLTIAKTKDHHSSVVASYADATLDESPLVSNSAVPAENASTTVIADNSTATPPTSTDITKSITLEQPTNPTA